MTMTSANAASTLSDQTNLPYRAKPVQTLNDQRQDNNKASTSDANSHDNMQNGGDMVNHKSETPADGHGIIVTDAADLPEPTKKKKNKPRRSAAQRGMGKPTGMETFFADTPQTPEEAARDQELYNPQFSVLDRLLTAIQQFERTRKLTPERRDIFYKWLHYGGVVISPNIGVGGQDQKQMEKDEVAQALSHALMSKELREGLETVNSTDPKYVVDFLGCMQSFFSRMVPTIWDISSKEKAVEITTTCMRFMEYLMQHDVCNEYRQDILQTRDFCRTAADQIWGCVEAQRWLPGDFNIACSTLFGGSYAQTHNPDATWDNSTMDGTKVFVGLTQVEATEIFSFGVAGAASEQVFQDYEKLNFSEVEGVGLAITDVIEGQGFEITDITPPSTECETLYKANSDKYRPVGRVIAIPWINEDAPSEDLTPEERRNMTAGKQANGEEDKQYVFFIESIVLQHLHVGQKVLATIRGLNCGIWFFDALLQVLPSFDLWLPNELVEDYKEPRWMDNAYAPGAPGWVKPGAVRVEEQKVEAKREIE